MKPKTLIMMVVAVACGVVVVYAMNQMNNQTVEEVEQVQVLHAAVDIRAGVPLDETNVYFKDMPKADVPEGAITTVEEYEERASKTPLYTGMLIVSKMLGDKGAMGASIEIPKGMRVVSVPVDSTTAHSGMLMPNDDVDLMVTWKENTERGPVQRTKIFLKKIKVFATDSIRDASSAADSGEIKAKNVSLVVTPKQAQMVMLAKSKGTLHLALRPPGSEDEDDESGDGDLSDDFLTDDEGIADNDNNQKEDNSLAAIEQEMMNQQKDQQKNEPAATVAPPKPVVPTWTINIYEGDKLRVERVVLPNEDGTPTALQMIPEEELEAETASAADVAGTELPGSPEAVEELMKEAAAKDEEMEELKSVTEMLKGRNLFGN